MFSKIYVDTRALGAGGSPIICAREDGSVDACPGLEVKGPGRFRFDATKDSVRVWFETDSEILMDDKTEVSAAQTAIDQAIDRWFGDHGIPNHYQPAKEDLKRRLQKLRSQEA